MPDLYTLFAKIQSLPKRRIAEVEYFVDFLALRRAGKVVRPPSRPRGDDGPAREPRSSDERDSHHAVALT